MARLQGIQATPYDNSLIQPLNMSSIGSLRSLKNINLGAATGTYASDSWGDKEVQWNSSPHIKQYKINESTEDVLALSVTWKRLRSGKTATIESLTDSELFTHITEEDRIEANTIRDYYKKKLVLWALKEVKLSPFRLDMSKFLHADGKLFTDKMLPLVYRLPEFYEYDISFADMMRDLAKYDDDSRYIKTYARNLRPLRKFRVKRSTEYWFKDEHDRAVVILLENLNPCKSLFEREFRLESTNMKISGIPTTRDSYSYFKVNKWEVE